MRRLAPLALLGLLAAACGSEPPPDHAAGHPGADHGGGEHAGHHRHHHGQGHDHDFSDVDRFAPIFDDPARDEWQRPAEVVERMALAPGMTVADIGAGTGYFLPHLVPAVSPGGRVLGLDVEPNMVAHMERRIAEEGLEGAEARRVAPDDPGLAPASVDRVLIVDTWHHIADREVYAEKLAASLRPGGSVWVVDFTEESEHGPPPEMRIPAAAVVAELEAGGLTARVVEDETLPMQYIVVGERGAP